MASARSRSFLFLTFLPLFIGCAGANHGDGPDGSAAGAGGTGGAAGTGGSGGMPQDMSAGDDMPVGPVVFGNGGSWSFDEGKGGTASGAALHGAPAWTVGKVATAVHLDGKADSVEPGPTLLDNSKSFSVAAWVRLDRVDQAASILSLNGKRTSSVTLGYWPASGSTPAGFGIAFAAEDKDGATATRIAAPFGAIADVWYHVAAAYDANARSAQLYVDGVSVASGAVNTTFAATGATSLGRGVDAGKSALFWPGLLDEVHLSDTLFSGADVTTLFNGAAIITPVRPPSVPLIVRSPYVSTWVNADSPAGNWPRFWAGQVTAITGMVRVDGKAYLFMGQPPGVDQAQQLQLEITATQTRYVFGAAGVHLYVDFISPVEADSIQKLSMPFGFIRTQAVSVDGKTHDVSLYFDISGEWAHGDSAQQITWTRADVAGSSQALTAFSTTPVSPTKFGEVGDYASWGTAVFATPSTGVQYEVTADTTARPLFTGGGTLANTMDTPPRAINNNWPVFAYQSSLGALGGVPSAPRTFVVGNVRTPLGSYQGADVAPLWQSYWPTWQAMLADAYKDIDNGSLVARADAMDKRVAVAAVAAGGAHYAALCALALRQAFGGVELANTAAEPWMFLKEISSDGNMSTVDVVYPAMPAYLFANPTLLRYLITPLLVYAESGLWPQPFAEHDIGSSYPVANGHNDGGGENMEVEESANMLLMAAAYLRGTNNSADAKAFITAHYAVLKKWADYLHTNDNALIPALQNQTDDFTGKIANSSNLALKGILAIGAFAQMATTLGNSADATLYSGVASNYIGQWNTKSQDTDLTHLKLAYDQDATTWSLKYNSYPDRLLHLGLIPQAVLTEETNWYSTKKNEFGIPLDNRHTYTKGDWELWTAAGISDPALRQGLIDTLYHFADKTPDRVPMTDWYETVTAGRAGFQARPVVGGFFSLLTLTP